MNSCWSPKHILLKCCTWHTLTCWEATWGQRRPTSASSHGSIGPASKVEDYCPHCSVCQHHSPKVTYRNPLIPLPIIETPFSRIALDIVRPLPKSSRGHRYLLVILDYTTRFPEVIPLRSATSKAVARELVQLFSLVGIADEILTDQGSCFMSSVMKETCL